MSESKNVIGIDGILEFGEYLEQLRGPGYQFYQFEAPDATGRLRESTLDEVCQRFQEFLGGRLDSFRVCITYADPSSNTLGKNDRTFTRSRG
jgi:hypothetical protein